MTAFKDLGLNPMILQALEEIGFQTPTAIQSKAIPHLINSEKDLIALAQTGTGKTAAFSLPIIQQLDEKSDSVQALILCPTRELAIQVAKDISGFLKYLSPFKVTAVFGGESISKQIGSLKKGPQIVVGTPGRTRDLINRRVLKVKSIKWLILDEADEMLKMGFKEELDDILKTTPSEKQTLLFSATMDKSVRRIASDYMRKPEEITVGTKNQGSDNVEHFYYVVHEKDRYKTLRRIADSNPDIHGIVFCRTRRETQKVAESLIKDHYSAQAIHGDVAQSQRTRVMNQFRDKKIQLLVATDVAARGIDVAELSHVINYKLPDSTEAYVHRSGRTGRAHSEGVSLVIVNMKEKHKIRSLENKIGKQFEQAKIPSGEDICAKQLIELLNKIMETEVDETQINKYLDLVMKKLEGIDRETLIKKFVSVEFSRFLEHYKDAEDLNNAVGKERSNSPSHNIRFALFRINAGKNLDMTVKDLFSYLNSNSKLRSVEIGNIRINSDDTTFEIDENFKNEVEKHFSGAVFNGQNISAKCEQTGIESTRAPKRKPRRKRRRF